MADFQPGRIRSSLHLALDGVASSPEKWSFDYASGEMQRIIAGNMSQVDTMLFGRNTFADFAAFWPGQRGPVAEVMNNTAKVVVSRTLKRAAWENTTLVSEDVPEAIAKLKVEARQEIVVVGSLALVRSLIGYRLLDVLELMIYPVVVGSGRRLFGGNPISKVAFDLTAMTPLPNGVIHAVYTRKGA